MLQTRSLLPSVLAAVAVMLSCVAALALPTAALAIAPGDFDPSFGANGQVFYPLGAGSFPASQVNAVAIEPNGRIVLGGSATDSNGNKAFLVATLNPDGSLDQSFGNGGRVVVQFGSGATPSSEVDAIAVQPDGKIVAGGGASFDYLVARLDERGNFDSSFGTGGAVIRDTVPTDPGGTLGAGTVRAVQLQRDGQIVTAGDALIPECCGVAVATRLSGVDGTLDDSFGGTGAVEVVRASNFGRHAAWAANALALQPDGKVLVAGTGADANSSEMLVARIAGNGDYDSSFADGGMFMDDPFADDEGRGSSLDAIALQPDGEILVAGAASGSNHPGSHTVLARVKPSNGSLDTSFGDGGLVFPLANGGDDPPAQIEALAVQPDGRILIGGFMADSNGVNELVVSRLTGAKGVSDPSFGAGGKVVRQLGNGGPSEIHALSLQADTGIVAAGLAGSQLLVTRLIGTPLPATGPGGSGSGGSGGTGSGGPGAGGSLGSNSGGTAVLSDLSLSPAVFAAAAAGPTVARHTGTLVSYTDNAVSTTMLTVLRPRRGVRRGHSCLKPKHGRSGRRCTRYVSVGRFTHSDRVGQNSFHFSGRLHHRKLAPGSYRLRARPRFGDPARLAVTVSFRIVR